MLSSKHNVLGKVLHTLIGYDDRPAGIQLLFYAVTLLVIVVLTSLSRRVGRAATTAPSSAGAALGIVSSTER